MTAPSRRPNEGTLTVKWVRNDRHPSRVDSSVDGDTQDPDSIRALLNSMCLVLSGLQNEDALSDREMDRFSRIRVCDWLKRLESPVVERPFF